MAYQSLSDYVRLPKVLEEFNTFDTLLLRLLPWGYPIRSPHPKKIDELFL